ncbi:MAG: NfeD family protein [Armatimonadetes bacterium]|nr:NfeD family protein [Armatimonadota bacterium]
MEWLTLPNVYLTMFFAGLGITALMLLFGLTHDFLGQFGDHDVSGGHDVGADQDVGASHGVSSDHDVSSHSTGLSHHFDFFGWLSTLFSPLMLSVFLTVFGGVGYLCSQAPGLSFPIINIPIAAFAGLFTVFGLLVPFRRWLQRMESTSHPTTHDLIGLIGESLSPIPPNGIGSIAYVFNDIRHTAPARNQSDKPIQRGTPVRIIGVAGNLLLVESAEERMKVWEQI